MTATFPPFNPGDPISAERMNALAAYAGGQYRGNGTGAGISYYGSTSLNASESVQLPAPRLVVAVEDFCERISDHLTIDDVPSGRCRIVRINNSNSHYAEQGGDFWVHDPSAGVFNIPSKIDGDVFHVVFNTYSKRWEIPDHGPQVVHVMLAETLYAAEDPLTNPSYALANVCRRNDDGTLRKTDFKILITNRFKRQSFDQGVTGTAIRVEQEWAPNTFDCNQDSASVGVSDMISEEFC